MQCAAAAAVAVVAVAVAAVGAAAAVVAAAASGVAVDVSSEQGAASVSAVLTVQPLMWLRKWLDQSQLRWASMQLVLPRSVDVVAVVWGVECYLILCCCEIAAAVVATYHKNTRSQLLQSPAGTRTSFQTKFDYTLSHINCS
jgi:hypothetical protein